MNRYLAVLSRFSTFQTRTQAVIHAAFWALFILHFAKNRVISAESDEVSLQILRVFLDHGYIGALGIKLLYESFLPKNPSSTLDRRSTIRTVGYLFLGLGLALIINDIFFNYPLVL